MTDRISINRGAEHHSKDFFLGEIIIDYCCKRATSLLIRSIVFAGLKGLRNDLNGMCGMHIVELFIISFVDHTMKLF